MKPDKRVFEIRFDGLYGQPVVVALTNGELKERNEVLIVVPDSELQRVQKLLDEAVDILLKRGVHDRDCACLSDPNEEFNVPCTCGFSDELSKLQGEGE